MTMTAVLNTHEVLPWSESPQLADPVPALSTDLAGALHETYGLSRREADVLHLIACGLSNQEIAGSLYLSINSVKTYIRSAYRRIGVTRRSQAVAWSVRRGLGYRASYPLAPPQPRLGA
jgi:DNA-binding CsgD family transcriptional regulator